MLPPADACNRPLFVSMNLRSFLPALLLASFIPASALGQAMPASPALATKNGVAATVNGKVITRNEVETAAKYSLMLLRQGISDAKSLAEREQEQLQSGLEGLIDRELLISEFERAGYVLKPQYVDEDIQRLIRENYDGNREALLHMLKQNGMTWAKFREQHRKKLIVMAMRGQATRNVVFPTPQQKEAFFKKNEALFREEGNVWIKTIAIPQLTGDPGVDGETQRARQRRLAEEIRRRLADGADFAAQARTYSQDSRASEGGDWGVVTRNALAPQLAEVAFSIPLKSISPVFDFRGFYYLMTVEQRTLGKLKPQAEVDQMLDNLVLADARQKELEAYLSKLRKKATISYPDPSLRPPARQPEVRPAIAVP